MLAFISFSAVASAIYILNDFFDLALDRKHPTKRNRPFASGALSIPFGFGAMVALIAVGIAAGLLLPIEFLGVLGGYMVVTTAYSPAVKRMRRVAVRTLEAEHPHDEDAEGASQSQQREDRLQRDGARHPRREGQPRAAGRGGAQARRRPRPGRCC